MERRTKQNPKIMQSVLNDHDHPHCHIVYSRVVNNGKTISDHNDRFRSQKACEDNAIPIP
ncbi:MAG: hypothetical protein K2I35_09570 [Duncaniella sp.]|nr:hypothetical protein [Duncaniella sp.]